MSGYGRNLFRKSLAQPAFEKEIIIEPQDIKNLSVKYNKKHLWSGLKDKEYATTKLRDDGDKAPKMNSNDVVIMLDKIEGEVDKITNQVDIALRSLQTGAVTQSELERIRSTAMVLSEQISQKKNVLSTGYTNLPALTNKGTFYNVTSSGTIIPPPALPALPPAAAVVGPALPAPAPAPAPAPSPAPLPPPPVLRTIPLTTKDVLARHITSANYAKFVVLSKMFPNFFQGLGAIEVDAPTTELILDRIVGALTQQDISDFANKANSQEKEDVRTKFDAELRSIMQPLTFSALTTLVPKYKHFGGIAKDAWRSW